MEWIGLEKKMKWIGLEWRRRREIGETSAQTTHFFEKTHKTPLKKITFSEKKVPAGIPPENR